MDKYFLTGIIFLGIVLVHLHSAVAATVDKKTTESSPKLIFSALQPDYGTLESDHELPPLKKQKENGIFILSLDTVHQFGHNKLTKLPYLRPRYQLHGVSKDGRKILLAYTPDYDYSINHYNQAPELSIYDTKTRILKKIPIKLPRDCSFPENALSPNGDYFLYYKAKQIPGLGYLQQNGTISEGGGHDIYLVRLDKPQEINLTPEALWNHSNAVISPNGKYLVYASDTISEPAKEDVTYDGRGYTYIIRIINLEGRLVTATTLRYNVLRGISWNPNSTGVLWSVEKPVVDSSNILVPTGQIYTYTKSGRLTRLLDMPTYIGSASYSPNGQKITFISPVYGRNEIWEMDANGLGLKNRSSWIKNENKWTPLWLSDGDRIVFRINGYQGNQLEGGIYTIGSDNKAPKLLFGGNVEKAYLIP